MVFHRRRLNRDVIRRYTDTSGELRLSYQAMTSTVAGLAVASVPPLVFTLYWLVEAWLCVTTCTTIGFGIRGNRAILSYHPFLTQI